MYKKLILLVSIVAVLVLISGAGAAYSDLVGWWKVDEGSRMKEYDCEEAQATNDLQEELAFLINEGLLVEN